MAKTPKERIVDWKEKKSLLGIIILIIVIIDILITVNQPAKSQTHRLQHSPQLLLTHGVLKPPTAQGRKGGSICPREKALQLPPDNSILRLEQGLGLLCKFNRGKEKIYFPVEIVSMDGWVCVWLNAFL